MPFHAVARQLSFKLKSYQWIAEGRRIVAFRDDEPDLYWIEFHVRTEIEARRPFLNRREQCVKVGNGPIVQEWSGCPDGEMRARDVLGLVTPCVGEMLVLRVAPRAVEGHQFRGDQLGGVFCR